MPLTLRDVELLALAIAGVHNHPEPETYAEGVKDAWHELVSKEPPVLDQVVHAPPAPPAAPEAIAETAPAEAPPAAT